MRRNTPTAIARVARCKQPAFATVRGLIQSWNKPAELLFGYTAQEACGRQCHMLLQGRDLFGNRFCSRDCPLLATLRAGEQPRSFVVSLCHASGDRLLSQVVPQVLREPHGAVPTVLHTVSSLAGSELTLLSRDSSPLSPRELEVLRLLDHGLSTRELAAELGISLKTARNHIDHLLAKLNAHHRLEALSIARRRKLL